MHTPSNLEQDDATNEIKEFLKIVTRTHGPLPPDLRYSQSTFLLEEGQTFYFNERTFSGPHGKRKDCYKNAFGHQWISDLTYVEGYCLGQIPFEHAWLVDKHGLVVEPTISNKDAIRDIRAYYGVSLDWEYVNRTALELRFYGVLDHRNLKLYRGLAQNWKANLTHESEPA